MKKIAYAIEIIGDENTFQTTALSNRIIEETWNYTFKKISLEELGERLTILHNLENETYRKYIKAIEKQRFFINASALLSL